MRLIQIFILMVVIANHLDMHPDAALRVGCAAAITIVAGVIWDSLQNITRG